MIWRNFWRPKTALPLALITLHAVLVWLARAPGIANREDDARYLLLSRALKAFTYRELWSPGAPPHHMYPPGFPLLIAVWTSIVGERYDWLIALQVVLSAAALVLTYDTIRRWVPEAVGFATLAVLAINPDLLRWNGDFGSEAALMFCVALVVWARHALPPGRWQTVLTLVASVAAPYIRAEGFVVPAALVAELLWRKEFRMALVVSMLFLVATGPLLWWTLNDPAEVVGDSYVGDFAQKSEHVSFVATMAKRVIGNVFYYQDYTLPRLLPIPGFGYSHPGVAADALLSLGFLGVGTWMAVKRLSLGIAILLVLAGLLLVWPYRQDRFIVPFLPALIVLFMLGLYRAGQSLHDQFGLVLIALSTVIALTVNMPVDLQTVSDRLHCERTALLPDLSCVTPRSRGFLRAVRFAGDSIPKGSTLLASKAAPVFLYAGLQVVRTSALPARDSASFWNQLGQRHVGYIMLTQVHATEGRIAPFMKLRCADRLRLLTSFPVGAYLFQVLPEKAAAGTPPPASERPSGADACSALEGYRQQARALSPPVANRH